MVNLINYQNSTEKLLLKFSELPVLVEVVLMNFIMSGSFAFGVWLAFAGLADLAVEVPENIKYSDSHIRRVFDWFDVYLSEDAQ